MTEVYTDPWLEIHQGDCRTTLAEMAAESVHCVVTSPPYWGLRDYGTAAWDGGDQDCDHRIGREMGNANKGAVRDVLDGDRSGCPCGAIRQDSQLGLEPTPEQYVENMVAVFREVRRVLRKDGTLWLNLGDSYAGSWGANGRGEGTNAPRADLERKHGVDAPNVPGLKPKDLVGIPWRVAFALQADGWYLRSDIIWAKPNPMPESVTDRPTKSHEYLFLLSKSPTYYFDADAVREAGTMHPAGGKNTDDGKEAFRTISANRNIRSVWTIATQPYPGAHFATFPPKLVEPCIMAGSSAAGVCPECGAPWRREVAVERGVRDDSTRNPDKASARRGMAAVPEKGWESERTTIGWQPSCTHDLGRVVPATVLDPFAGSGTTLMVAQQLSRRAVGIDLNADYLVQCLKRNAQTPLGLAE